MSTDGQSVCLCRVHLSSFTFLSGWSSCRNETVYEVISKILDSRTKSRSDITDYEPCVLYNKVIQIQEKNHSIYYQLLVMQHMEAGVELIIWLAYQKWIHNYLRDGVITLTPGTMVQ